MRTSERLRVQASTLARSAPRPAAALARTEAQGTTEYAILVGVLVVTNTSHWR